MKDSVQHIEQAADRAFETLEDIVARKSDSEPQPDSKPQPDNTKSVYNKFALSAILVALIAWGMLLISSLWSGYAALGLGLASVILAAFGLKSPRRGWRDLSTTALIAGAVLSVVIISFIIVIYVGLNGI